MLAFHLPYASAEIAALSIVETKLLYGLRSLWLNVAERRRLNGFQNRCLRKIWNIQPFHSRVSNADVLTLIGQKCLTQTLHKQQLLLFAKVATAPADSILRSVTFCDGSLRPATDRYVRKIGRPRLDWATEIGKLALRLAGSAAALEILLKTPAEWKRLVDSMLFKVRQFFVHAPWVYDFACLLESNLNGGYIHQAFKT